MITIHYFASVREAMGREHDELEQPDSVTTVADLVRHLSERDTRFAGLASGENPLLVAVNQTMASPSQSLSADDEVAFFPPMTGG